MGRFDTYMSSFLGFLGFFFFSSQLAVTFPWSWLGWDGTLQELSGLVMQFLAATGISLKVFKRCCNTWRFSRAGLFLREMGGFLRCSVVVWVVL